MTELNNDQVQSITQLMQLVRSQCNECSTINTVNKIMIQTFRKTLMPSSSVLTVREKCYLNQIYLHAVLTVFFNVFIMLKKSLFHIQNFLTASIT